MSPFAIQSAQVADLKIARPHRDLSVNFIKAVFAFIGARQRKSPINDFRGKLDQRSITCAALMSSSVGDVVFFFFFLCKGFLCQCRSAVTSVFSRSTCVLHTCESYMCFRTHTRARTLSLSRLRTRRTCRRTHTHTQIHVYAHERAIIHLCPFPTRSKAREVVRGHQSCPPNPTTHGSSIRNSPVSVSQLASQSTKSVSQSVSPSTRDQFVLTWLADIARVHGYRARLIYPVSTGERDLDFSRAAISNRNSSFAIDSRGLAGSIVKIEFAKMRGLAKD